jgi:outer membrane receptor for ferrienterochelin and colicins
MLRILPILFFLCSFSITYAQSANIEGVVVDETGNPLPFASVGLRNTQFGIASDIDGQFKLEKIPFGHYELAVRSVGFEVYSQVLSISYERNYFLRITLKEKSETLEAVVVSGTMKEVSKMQSPVPIEVYTSTFFESNKTPSLFESLQNVNGVRPQVNCNVCNTGDIHINGLEGPYTMVLIDGMPIVSGLSTVYGLTGIPQALIERVEIVKGPASTLYGSEAVGGLINIITKSPDLASKVNADVMVSGWGEVNTDLGFRYRLGKRVNSLTGINYFNYQNPIDNNDDGFTDLTLQNRISVFNKISIDRSSQKTFDIAGRYVFEDRWGGQMNWKPEHRGGEEVYGENIETKRWEIYSTYELPTKESLTFQISANGHQQNSAYGSTIYNADQIIGFSQLLWNKMISNHDLLFGLIYRYTFYDDNTFATSSTDGLSNSPTSIHLPGLFIQNEWTLSSQQKLLVGLRYDYNSNHGSILTPRLNYKWNSADQTAVFRASIGNGYRVANIFTEDHAALTGARQVVFEGELKPETSWNANLNFVKKKYTKNGVFIGVDVSTFYTYFFNRILPDYDTDPNKIIYGNLEGNAVSKGISTNLDISWKSGLKGLLGITVMDVALEENGNKERQILTESVQGVWSLGYEIIPIDLTIDYTGNLYGPMRLPLLGDLDPRDEYSPWYSIQNIQLTKIFGPQWEIYGGVKNLLNFTPPANSIARAFDPFDKHVEFDNQGNAMTTSSNPYALTFDPSYVYAANQGIRFFLGCRLVIQ